MGTRSRPHVLEEGAVPFDPNRGKLNFLPGIVTLELCASTKRRPLDARTCLGIVVDEAVHRIANPLLRSCVEPTRVKSYGRRKHRR